MSEPLYELKLKLISACDHRCQMCGHWREPVTRLTTDEALAALDDAKALGTRSVIFSGGEPTLHKGLLACVERAAGHGLRVTLATNGGGLAEGTLEALVAAGVSQFNVSIDSPDPAVHDHIRGIPGSFERITAGMVRAAALDRKVAVKTVVTRDGFASLGALPALADRVPVHSFSLTLVTANEPELTVLLLSRAECERYFFDILPRVLEGAAARRLPVKLFPIFRALVGQKPAVLAKRLRAASPADFDAELSAFSQGRYGAAFAGQQPCPVLRGKALVRPDGGVYFCCEVSHTGELEMGQLKPPAGDARLGDGLPRGLAATWLGPAYASLRTRAPTPVHEKCWSCTEWFSRPPEALLKVAPAAAANSVRVGEAATSAAAREGAR